MDLSRENQLISQLIGLEIPPYPFYDDTTISRISQTIATIFYSRETSKNQRQSLIDLIQKWTGFSHYFPENQDVFINCLFKNTRCEKIQPIEEKVVRKKYNKFMETKIRTRLIDGFQQKQFDQIGFEVNIPVKSFQNNAESLIDFLTETSVLIDDELTDTINEDSVLRAILSLIQLNVSNSEMLDKLFDDLIKLTPKSSVTDFIRYIWTKPLLNDEIRIKMLQKFKFLYEKPVLNYLCSVLNDEIKENNEMKDVLICCSKDLKLSNNVFNLLDCLLKLSNYDLRVLEMINLMKNEYFHSDSNN